MTAGTAEKTAGRPWQLSAEALALWRKFPPRTVPASWPATRQSRGKVVARLLAPPFLAETSQDRCNRKLALLKVLDWLELHPGRTWQDRWDASGAEDDGRRDWRRTLLDELAAAGNLGPRGEQTFKILGLGMAQLIGADVIRPGLGWLMATSSPMRIANEMGRARDPAGLARLREFRETGIVGEATAAPAIEKVALIMAAKGGMVADITVGDCLELVRTSREAFPGPSRSTRHSPFFYQLLHAAGIFPAAAPPTVRMFNRGVAVCGAHIGGLPTSGGYVLVPGLIDAHLHFESTKLMVDEFAPAVLPHGTINVVIDPHDVANVPARG